MIAFNPFAIRVVVVVVIWPASARVRTSHPIDRSIACVLCCDVTSRHVHVVVVVVVVVEPD
jgi:hypothetical protein